MDYIISGTSFSVHQQNWENFCFYPIHETEELIIQGMTCPNSIEFPNANYTFIIK